MSATQTLASASKTATGLSHCSHDSSSSSSSAERYRLDESSLRPILLYKYRGRLQTSSQKELCAWLDKDESLRATRLPIPRYTSYVDVKRRDLYLPEEKELYSEFPNYDASLASIKLPALAYWSRLFLGGYDELFIVSPETSPASSLVDEESRRTSPTHTWGHSSEEDAGAGAERGRKRDVEE